MPHTKLAIPALHLIWVPNALNLLLAKEVIEHVDFGGDSSVRSTRDFVSDLVGWDILRYSGPPPPPPAQQQAGSDDSDDDEDSAFGDDADSESDDE